MQKRINTLRSDRKITAWKENCCSQAISTPLPTFKVTNENDFNFIVKQESMISFAVVEKEKERPILEGRGRGPNITNIDTS